MDCERRGRDRSAPVPARPRRRRCRPRRGGGHRDCPRSRRDPVRAVDGRPRAAVLARRLGREVRGAQRGAVDARPPRARTSRSRRREAALREDRERRRGRVALLAAARGRGARVPVHADRGVRVDVAGPRFLLERGGRDRRPGRREGRVRVGPEPLTIDVALRVAPRTCRARRGARLGCRRLRLREGQGANPERPRRPRSHLARDRRLLRRRNATSGLRHLPGAHRAVDDLGLRVQGRAPRHTRVRSGAG